jgi:hypothetical protein
VVRIKSTDVSEEHSTCMFGVEEYAKQENEVLLAACSLLGLLFDPKDGSITLLQTSVDIYQTTWRNHCESLKSCIFKSPQHHLSDTKVANDLYRLQLHNSLLRNNYHFTFSLFCKISVLK